MVVIDTDVLVLAFAFQEDQRRASNRIFLETVQSADPAITVYNLMEFLGQLSFNLSPSQLDQYQSWLLEAYHMRVIWPFDPENTLTTASFKAELFDRPFAKMRSQRMSFMDALVLDLAERTPSVADFVTWNARHFKNKTTLTVLTPAEYLAQAA